MELIINPTEREQKIAFTQQLLNLLQKNAGLYYFETLEELRRILKRMYKQQTEQWQEDHFVFSYNGNTIGTFCCKERLVQITISEKKGLFYKEHLYQYQIYEPVEWMLIKGRIKQCSISILQQPAVVLSSRPQGEPC